MTLPTGEVICTAIEKVVYGQRTAPAVAAEVARLEARRVFLLVSQTLDERTDEIAQVRGALGKRYAGQFAGIPPHGPRTAIIEAANAARDADADLIVTIGGGTLTDAGKIMLVCLKYGIREHDELEPHHIYVNENGDVVKPELQAPDLRMIAVPTTLSGGEFNPLGGATDEKRKLKQGYEQRLLVPVSVVLDPALTVHTPEWLWMSTGVRSLDHAMETLGSHLSNDFCDGIAESAIRLLANGLTGVKAQPSDLGARLRCQIGTWQSMIPVVSGVPMGASHAIGHVLGGTCNVPHGYTSCVMAPYVLAFNEPVNGERQQRISHAFGAPGRPASELVDEFIRGLGMPRTLSAVGVTERDLQQVAEYTMEDLWARTNPRPIEKSADVLEILRLAI